MYLCRFETGNRQGGITRHIPPVFWLESVQIFIMIYLKLLLGWSNYILIQLGFIAVIFFSYFGPAFLLNIFSSQIPKFLGQQPILTVLLGQLVFGEVCLAFAFGRHQLPLTNEFIDVSSVVVGSVGALVGRRSIVFQGLDLFEHFPAKCQKAYCIANLVLPEQSIQVIVNFYII